MKRSRSGGLAGPLIVFSLVAGLGAGPPEVVKVRVPESRVGSFFPAGADLHVLTPARFEELVRDASRPPAPPAAPRLIRASHAASWDAGTLSGRSELTAVMSGPDRAGLLALEPWSPAVVGGSPGRKLARATEDGRLALRVEAGGPAAIPLDWQLRARPGSQGRAFLLALPDSDLASLTLDLPAGLVPEAGAGRRFVAARAASPTPGRSIWRAEGASGRLAIRLLDEVPAGAVAAAAAATPPLWLSGPTRIDLNDRAANWRAEWTLEDFDGRPRRLTVDLDPGLDLVDVAGPMVASFRAEGRGDGSRVTIGLDGEAAGPSPLTIRAACRAPTDGPWPIPSARPIGAIWTDGRTTVRLDDSHVLQACAERSGRRVDPRAGDPTGPLVLAFEPGPTPGPVAELTFHKPTFDATGEVRGHLRLGREVPTFEAALSWRVARGRVPAHAVDLSPGWTPDRVTYPDGQPVAWHAEPLPNGSTRVHMSPTAEGAAGRPLSLLLRASGPRAGIAGPLDLPRVRPSTPSVRVADEIWVATIDPTLAVRPILGRGLAWIEPPATSPPWGDRDLRGSLAWRWLADDAEARVDRSSASPAPSADVALVATIARGRLLLEWALKIEAAGEDARSIPVQLDEAADFPARWVPIEPGRPDVAARPLPDERGAALGFPRGGPAWSIEIPAPHRGRVELKGRVERPWAGSGNIPILTLPPRYRARGSIVLRVEDTSRLRLDAAGLTAIEGGEAIEGGSATPVSPPGGDNLGLRTAATFGYRRGGGRLGVTTIPGRVEPAGGVVREAHLATQAFPGSGLLQHRLTLRIAAGTADSFGLTMPPGVAVDRLRRDGLPVAARPDGPSLRIPIPAPSPGRPSAIVTLDYRTPGDLRSGRLRPATLLPAVAVPCSAFLWELTTPGPWRLDSPPAGLVDTEPRPARDRLSDLLGLHPIPWPGGTADTGEAAREAMLLDLERVRGDEPASVALGDWLVKLDSGRWPVVVDRLALQASGLGPMTRVEANLPGAASLGAPSVVLQRLGLRAVAADGVILITAKAREGERPGSFEGWSSMLIGASREGADASDRFQSAARWRGEVTPRASSSGVTPDRMTVPEGWETRRLVAVGWPSSTTAVTLVDGQAEARWAWAIAALVVLAGVLAGDRPARARAIGFGLAWMLGALGVAWAWPEPYPAAIGLLRGGLVVLACWLGRSAREFLPSRRAASPPETTTRSRLGPRAGGMILLLGPVGATAFAASRVAGPDPPIVAVLPYGGPVDLAAPPSRVVMLLDDYERLARLAGPGQGPARALATLTAIHHRVARSEDGSAAVETRCEVEVEGQGTASWSIPVGPCFDLSATVDDRPTPLAIARDGRSAAVELGGRGSHRVVVRRAVPIGSFGEDGGRVRLPVNRAAFAEVEVVRDRRGHWVEIPGAAGEVGVGGGGIAGGLGPEESLEVRWFAKDRPPAVGPRGPVEAAELWEARPGGDLIRVRLNHSDPEGIASLALALDPGALVRGFTIPGAIAARAGGTADRPEWSVGIDPPLPKGVPIELALWKPAAPGSPDRRPPGFRLLGDAPVSGVLGFRRPSGWSGRLLATGEAEALGEASFVRAWGTLPDDGLTLAGAIRIGVAPAPAVATGPVTPRRAVRTTVLTDLGAGRLDVTIDAELADLQGRSFAVELGLPADFRVLRVNADGLVDWLRVARDRVRLQFESPGSPGRRVKIQGYLPVAADPVLSESRAYQCKVPWPRWLEAEAAPGELTLNGPGRFQLGAGEGVVVTSPPAPDEDGASFRATYRVDRPEGLGMLRWSPPTARVGVSVASDLMLDPSVATWTAVVDCGISGGPVEALHWKVPTEWAREASLEVVGSSHRLEAKELGDSTSWDILPDAPLWGRARLVLRSRRPLTADASFAYPEITPLSSPGRGSVESYDVAIANVSGRSLEVAGSAGLQAIDPARYRSRESPAPASSIRRAYHVTGDRWSLRLRLGRGEKDRRSGGDEGDHARAARAQVSCGLGQDGTVWGRATYTLKGRPGPFLRVRLADSARITWASVDGRVVPSLREDGGRWLIPLGDRRARQVALAWHCPASGDRLGERIALPEVDREAVPTLVSATGPGPAGSLTPSEGLTRLDRPAWEAANLGRLAGRIVELLTDFDRGSREDRDAALADLVEFEVRSRSFERSRSEATAASALALARTARGSIEEASQTAGLDDLLEEARSAVGLAPAKADDPAEPGSSEPPEPFRVRRIGPTSYFQGAVGGGEHPSTIDWEARPPVGHWGRVEPWSILGAGLLTALGLARLASRPFRPHGRIGKAALAAASIATLAAEPFGMAALVAAFFVGRSAGPTRGG